MLVVAGIVTRLHLMRSWCKEIKRFKYKKKWAMNLKHKSNSKLALEHFDTFYKPVYGELWPLIRISLLSKQKYCALVNNEANYEDISMHFQQRGLENIIQTASDTKVKKIKEKQKKKAVFDDQGLDNQNWHEDEYPVLTSPPGDEDDYAAEPTSPPGEKSDVDLIDPLSMNPDTNLNDFMPVEKVYSQKEIFKAEEVRQSVYEARDIQLERVYTADYSVPETLRAFCYKRGDISDFSTAKEDASKMLDYYLFDASSLLPVIALDLKPHDSVLDLCAAPGGKTLAMLQMIDASKLTCNDASQGRLRRLKDVLTRYCPTGSDVLILQQDGRRMRDELYTKVLVDVPCNNDRQVVLEDDNNLFKPGRKKERMELTAKQKDLLIAAIKCCKPGGSVVYSTCTMSPAQNDGVVQAAAEEIWQETNIDIVVNDLSWMASKFRNTFNFFNKCQHGQLVIPSLTANFGPMYFCKISRLK